MRENVTYCLTSKATLSFMMMIRMGLNIGCHEIYMLPQESKSELQLGKTEVNKQNGRLGAVQSCDITNIFLVVVSRHPWIIMNPRKFFNWRSNEHNNLPNTTMAHLTKFTHPFLLFIANQLLQRYTTAYTQSRITRSLVLLLSIFLSYTAIYHWNHHINTTGGAGRFLAGALFTTPNLILDRLIIRNWQYDATDLKPKLFAEKKKENEEMLTRLEWAGEVGTSLRYIDTPYEVSNVPFFGFGDPVLGPEKRVFILQHAGIIVALYFLNTLAIDGQLRANQEFLNDSYIPWFGRMFGGDISHFREELSTRVTVSLLYWVAQFCILQFLFSVGALLDVGLGGGEVRLWRPMFGEWRHACTMRGFWG